LKNIVEKRECTNKPIFVCCKRHRKKDFIKKFPKLCTSSFWEVVLSILIRRHPVGMIVRKAAVLI
jgi:hypothetical protein